MRTTRPNGVTRGRVVGWAVGVAALAPLASCGLRPEPAIPSCSAFSTSIAESVVGQGSERAALAEYLARRPGGYPPDPADWHRIGGRPATWVSGHAQLSVVRLPLAHGYLVDGGATCS